MPDDTNEPIDSGPPPFFGDRAYAIVKALAQVILPAAGTAYIGLSEIWGLDYAREISSSIVVITTFLGVVLAVSSRNYVKSGTYIDGRIVIDRSPNRDTYRIELDGDPEEVISQKDGIILKVENGDGHEE